MCRRRRTLSFSAPCVVIVALLGLLLIRNPHFLLPSVVLSLSFYQHQLSIAPGTQIDFMHNIIIHSSWYVRRLGT